MEYFISINQDLFTEWFEIDSNTGEPIYHLDSTDAIIISAVYKYQNPESGFKLDRLKKSGAVWIQHAWFIKQFPLLNLKKTKNGCPGLRRRFQKLVDYEILTREIKYQNVNNRAIKKTYYHTSPRFQKMLEYSLDKQEINLNKEMPEWERTKKLKKLQRPFTPTKQMVLDKQKKRKSCPQTQQKRDKQGKYCTDLQVHTPRTSKSVHRGLQSPHDPITIDPITYKKEKYGSNFDNATGNKPDAHLNGAPVIPEHRECKKCGKDIYMEIREHKKTCTSCNTVLPKKALAWIEEAVKG